MNEEQGFTSLELHLLRALMISVVMLKAAKRRGLELTPRLDNLFNEVKDFSIEVAKDAGNILGEREWVEYVIQTTEIGTLRYMPDGTFLEGQIYGGI